MIDLSGFLLLIFILLIFISPLFIPEKINKPLTVSAQKYCIKCGSLSPVTPCASCPLPAQEEASTAAIPVLTAEQQTIVEDQIRMLEKRIRTHYYGKYNSSTGKQKDQTLLKEWQTQPSAAISRWEHECADRERETARKQAEYEALLTKHAGLLEKFYGITDRKIVIDEYGDETWDVLDDAIKTLKRKLAAADGLELYKDGTFRPYSPQHNRLIEEIPDIFKRWRASKPKQATADLNGLSGIEFETYIADILRQQNYDVAGTPTTGDQGADLIAKKDGMTFIIQAKRYQGTVGNKAVQEVIGALAFYGGDEAWVITNSAFTPSAIALAQKGNVRLIDGVALKYLPAIPAGTETLLAGNVRPTERNPQRRGNHEN